jgi:plastocyanin
MRSSRRIAAAASSGAALALFLFPVVPAAAGGGCHSAEATEGTGATVELGKNCMTPTVLRVDPGTTVTFRSFDPVDHNLYGLGWGEDIINNGDVFQRRFESAGTYPYACLIHLGMVGAIVVGDGRGSGPVIEMGSVTPTTAAAALPAAAPAAARDSDDVSGGGALPFALGAVAVAIASGVAFRAGRRRPNEPAT